MNIYSYTRTYTLCMCVCVCTYKWTRRQTHTRTMNRCSLTTELRRDSDVAAVCVCIRIVGPQSHIFLSSAGRSSSWPTAHRGRNHIIEEDGCGGGRSRGVGLRQSIRLSGSLLPVNHAIQWWVCASERTLAVCASSTSIRIIYYVYTALYTVYYIYYFVTIYYL